MTNYTYETRYCSDCDKETDCRVYLQESDYTNSSGTYRRISIIECWDCLEHEHTHSKTLKREIIEL